MLSLGESANKSNRIASYATLKSPQDKMMPCAAVVVDHVVACVRYGQIFAMTLFTKTDVISRIRL